MKKKKKPRPYKPLDLGKLEKKYKKPPQSNFFYYLSLLFAVLILFCISLILLPILLVMHSFPLYIILIFLGIMFGLIVDFVIFHNKSLKKQHRVITGVLMFVVAFILMLLTTYYSNKIISAFNLSNHSHNTLTIALVYSISFILPYVYSRAMEKR